MKQVNSIDYLVTMTPVIEWNILGSRWTCSPRRWLTGARSWWLDPWVRASSKLLVFSTLQWLEPTKSSLGKYNRQEGHGCLRFTDVRGRSEAPLCWLSPRKSHFRTDHLKKCLFWYKGVRTQCKVGDSAKLQVNLRSCLCKQRTPLHGNSIP